MASSVITKHNYLDPHIVFYRKPIYEYDMKQGGFSILKEKKILTEDEISYIEGMRKEDRVVYIGKILRDRPYLNKVLNEGFVEARKLLYENNDLEDSNIITIKKDAVFINKKIKNMTFGNYTFDLKHKFTFLAVLNGIEFYLDENNEMIIKGLGDNTNNIFLDDLKKIFILVKKNDMNSLLRHLKKYRYNYLTRNLDIECYRELNIEGCFRTYKRIADSILLMEDVMDVDDIDIQYNYMKYILPIIQEIV